MPTPASPRTAVKEYLDYCTGHGLGRIKNTPYIVLKIFWALALMTAVAFVVVQVTRLTQTWLSQPISTKVELETRNSMRFPAVTLCNLNPVQYSKIISRSDLMDVIREAALLYDIPLSQFGHNVTDTGAGQSDQTPTTVLPASTTDYYDYEYTDYYYETDLDFEINDDFEADLNFKLLVKSLHPDEITELSQGPEEFLVSCVFAGSTCDVRFFEVYRSLEYGDCLTFGSSGLEEKYTRDLEVSTYGKEYGLTVTLNVDQKNYVPFLSEAAGVLVKVHPPDESPFEQDNNIIAPTGFKTDIDLRKVVENRIPGPQKRCTEDNTFHNIWHCQQVCLESVILEECNCSYGNARSDEQSVNCITQEETECIVKVRRSLTKNIRDKCTPCVEPCSQVRYEKSVSMSTWPANHFKPLLRKKIQEYQRDLNLTDFLTESTDIRENLVNLQIYLSTFTVETLVEETSYSDENFVSDIGGQLGLWVGFSVLSLCEVIELLILIIDTFRHRRVQSPGGHVTKTVKN